MDKLRNELVFYCYCQSLPTGLGERYSLLRNLYITNPLCFVIQGPGQRKVLYSQLIGNATEIILILKLTLPITGLEVMKLFFPSANHLCLLQIFGSFGNPALEKLEFRLQPPLSYFDHLVSQVKITILASSLIIDLGSGQTGSAVLLMSVLTCCLAPKCMFVYFVYYRYLESEKATLLSDPRQL